jgi:hypothetical protein
MIHEDTNFLLRNHATHFVKIMYKGIGIFKGEDHVFKPHILDTWHII